MCYRISIKKSREEVENEFNIPFSEPDVYKPYFDFNMYEDKNLYIIRQDDPELIDFASWGLLPTGYDLSKRKEFFRDYKTFNARSENVFTSSFFSEFIGWQKCLIIADGFIEPHKDPDIKGSIPFNFRKEDDGLFAFAGLYSEIDNGSSSLYSATIITMEANDYFRKIHNNGKNRQPLILSKERRLDWLYCKNNRTSIEELLISFTDEPIQAYPVSQDIYKPKVNSDRPDILEPFHYPELNDLFS